MSPGKKNLLKIFFFLKIFLEKEILQEKENVPPQITYTVKQNKKSLQILIPTLVHRLYK